MLNAKEVFVKITEDWESALAENGLWKLKDVEIRCVDNKVSIKADESRIKKIKFLFDIPFGRESRILGDCWERAYGDMEWRSIAECGEMPWYFIAKDVSDIYCFGVKTQPNAMCSWFVENNKIAFIADVSSGKNGVDICGRVLDVAEFVFLKTQGDVFDVSQKFCGMMCENPRMPKYPVYGGNDWYCNYGNSSYEKIITHAKRMAECAPDGENRPYMVIDDGWEICHHQSENDDEYFNGGPWKYPNGNFKDMKKLADEITAMGVIPGIWMRPLWTTEKFPDEYILKHYATKYTLDPSVPEVLEQVKSDIKQIVDWGYRLIKHDFSSFDIFGKWGMSDDYCEINCSFANEKKTTAEIIKDLYAAVREAAGDDVLILGCNTISHLAAGFFEIQRTGDDTSGIEWERTRKMGINTLAFRMCHHGTFYAADADCVGITKDVEWAKNRQWLDLLAKSGTPLFVSVAEDAYDQRIKKDISDAFSKASEKHNVSRPADWLENTTPEKWVSDFGVDSYCWD